jgi:outer membrane receptor protein involved in Fe transport
MAIATDEATQTAAGSTGIAIATDKAARSTAGSAGVAIATDRKEQQPAYRSEGMIRLVAGLFQTEAAAAPPVEPTQPVTPEQPIGPTPQVAGLAGPTPTEIALLSRRLYGDEKPATKVATGEQAQATGSSDLGGLLSQASSVQSVEVQRRSPVSLDPNIRGYKAGQIYSEANGVYWVPARRDLDTMLSKIDPGMIQDVVVLPGPYGLRSGPGLAFIDVLREPTPRHKDGFEAHFDSSGNLRTNGSQLYGRETVYGGSCDWGFRFSYGDRAGSDYRAGNGLNIPSSYHNRDVWGELSYDINPHQHVNFAYQRLDQTNTEYPGQFFDIGYLGTYGFEARVVDEDPAGPWSKFTIEGWYNRTGFRGDTSRKHNPNFPVLERVEFALDELFVQPPGTNRLSAATQGALASSGARAAMTLGDPDDTHVNLGVDFRYLEQVIRENYLITQDGAFFDSFSTNMPHSWLTDPGLYLEWSKPFGDAWTLSLGGRVDLVGTKARASDLRDDTVLPGGASDLAQTDVLYAFYLNNKLKLDEHWTLTGGFGHGQRPPTLIERYADGLFLSSLQSGFTRMIGDPQLQAERDWQLDVGLSAEHENWRGKANFFHAWVNEYITYEDESVVNFADARLLRFVNTDLATLVGFELFGECDLYPRLSPFAKMSYVDGRDRELDAPLPAIPPLDTTVGVRLHNPEKERSWEIELAARIVNDQNRLGTIRLLGTSTTVEERTGGFTVWHLRGYWNYTKNFHLIAGIDNLFDRTYQEHLDLRILGPTGFPAPPTRVWAPGITPYFAVNWIY